MQQAKDADSSGRCLLPVPVFLLTSSLQVHSVQGVSGKSMLCKSPLFRHPSEITHSKSGYASGYATKGHATSQAVCLMRGMYLKLRNAGMCNERGM